MRMPQEKGVRLRGDGWGRTGDQLRPNCWRLNRRINHLSVINHDPFKECLVELAAELAGGYTVHALTVRYERERQPEATWLKQQTIKPFAMYSG